MRSYNNITIDIFLILSSHYNYFETVSSNSYFSKCQLV